MASLRLNDGSLVELELRHVAITATGCGSIDVEAQILVTLGLKCRRCNSFCLAAKWCAQFGQSLAIFLLGILVVGSINAPFRNMVVIGRTTSEGHRDSVNIGCRQFYLQIVCTIGNTSSRPCRMPEGCCIAVKQFFEGAFA